MKKISCIVLIGCLLASLIGCGSTSSDTSSAITEQTSSVDESVSSTEESSISESEVVDTRLTKEIIMEYIDQNKSDIWGYEEDKYSDDLTIWMLLSEMDPEITENVLYIAPSRNWYVEFFPYLYWDDEANSLIFDPYIAYSSAWFLDYIGAYDEIQIATDNEHMKIIIDEDYANYDVEHSESEGFAYMAEEDIDDLKQLLEMLDDNPSVRLNPVNAEETIEFYLTDTMIMQFKEALNLYFELQEIIR